MRVVINSEEISFYSCEVRLVCYKLYYVRLHATVRNLVRGIDLLIKKLSRKIMQKGRRKAESREREHSLTCIAANLDKSP